MLENEIDVIKKRIKNKRENFVVLKPQVTENKYLKNLVSRLLITIILVLISIIYINSGQEEKMLFKAEVLTKNFSFAPFKAWYQKNFGKIIPIDTSNESATVFDNEIVHKKIDNYNNGVKVTLSSPSVISSITSGIVVYIGEKEGYGNTIIIQGIDGVDIWYGNITNISVALYDYVEAKNVIGESNGDFIYYVLSKDGEYLNYEEYIQKNKNQ